MFSPPIKKASAFLASHQDDDGFWRDYGLEPGASDAWITACVGFALSHVERYKNNIFKAVDALLSIQRPQGWGYNTYTACDADSTAWAIRFLASIDAINRTDAIILMNSYITPSQRVRTFVSTKQFGSWANEHDEVTPVAGMALLSCGALDLAQSLRQSCIQQKEWNPFWWQCYSYTSAHTLEFLSLSGGIPKAIRVREVDALKRSCSSSTPSSFDLAHQLSAAQYLDDQNGSYKTLLEMQQEDGSWPSSTELFVPDQKDGNIKGIPYADTNRLLSTAMAMMALIKRDIKYREPQ